MELIANRFTKWYGRLEKRHLLYFSFVRRNWGGGCRQVPGNKFRDRSLNGDWLLLILPQDFVTNSPHCKS